MFCEARGGMVLQLMPWLVQALLQSPPIELRAQRWLPPPQAATTVPGGGEAGGGGRGAKPGEGWLG